LQWVMSFKKNRIWSGYHIIPHALVKRWGRVETRTQWAETKQNSQISNDGIPQIKTPQVDRGLPF
jgi:hypothetical protein